MKSTIHRLSVKLVSPGLALSALFMLPGCKLPTTDARRSMQTVGLFQSLVDHALDQTGDGAKGIVSASGTVPEGKPAPGYRGFVYSPFTDSPSLVDVSACRAGQKICCPYTRKVFKVPALPEAKESKDRQVAVRQSVESIRPPSFAMATTPVPFRPAPDKAEHTDELLKKLDLTNFGFFLPNVLADVGPGGQLPFGIRIKDKPGFVYSPYASRSQLVDVAGISPGVDVSCPYTGKHFRVPEEITYASH